MIRNELIPITQIDPHPRNYQMHGDDQLHSLAVSHTRFGQYRSLVLWARPDGRYVTVAGHGILEAMRANHVRDVRADVLPEDTPPDTIEGILIADNETARMSTPDEEMLVRLLQEQQEAGHDLHSLGSDEETLRQLLARLEDEAAGLHDVIEKPIGKPNPRKIVFDMIFTWNRADGLCCLAVQAGLRYGFQSAGISERRGTTFPGICPLSKELWSGRHAVTFIDNDYFHYDHAFHLSVVREHHPKYATVRDVMTMHQCTTAGIDYYPLEQVLDWAEELAAYTANVIVIPKYDCLDAIPEKFVLGYSVPSSHGGTPLPIEAFRGRRVHLLGGSWKAQLGYMAALGDDVVSADNNQIALLATKFGTFTLPDGDTQSLTEAGFASIAISNPRYVAFALSVGAIAMKVNELYPQERATAQEEEEEELCLMTLRS